MTPKISARANIKLRSLLGAVLFGSTIMLSAIHHATAQPLKTNPPPISTTATTASTASTSSPFELVLVDSASEKQLGGFPVDRVLIAKAITVLKEAGARGVVLKFFYDQPGTSAESDKELADAIGSIKTLLQARMDEAELTANPLPARFMAGMVIGDYKSSLTGTSGWIPLAPFAAAAFDIGFVDTASPDSVPIIESYQNKPVKSLTLATLEMATGKQAKIDSGARVTLGEKSLTLTDDNQVPLKLTSIVLPDYMPFTTLVDHKTDKAQLQEKFRDKVVVIAYDGEKMHFLTTRVGTVKAHRLFYLGLLDVYRQWSALK